jgi:hypothetical protein
VKVAVFAGAHPAADPDVADPYGPPFLPALAKRVPLEVRALAGGWTPPAMAGVTVRWYDSTMSPLAGVDPRLQAVLDLMAADANMVADPLDVDIVHALTRPTRFAGFLAKRMYGCGLVATVHPSELRPSEVRPDADGASGLFAHMERVGLRACDRVVAVSEAARQLAVDVYGVSPDAVVVIPGEADTGAQERGGRGPARTPAPSPSIWDVVADMTLTVYGELLP